MPYKKIKQVIFCSLLSVSNIVIAQPPKLMLPISHTGNIRTAVLSPDGKKLVTGSTDATAKVWDIATGKLLADITGATWPVYAITFSSDGQKFITSAMERSSKIWSAKTGKIIADLDRDAAGDGEGRSDPEGMEPGFSTVQFSPDGEKVLTYDDIYPSVRTWDAATGKFLFSMKEDHDALVAVLYSPDEKKILLATNESASIWDAASGNTIQKLDLKENDAIYIAKFSPDSKQVITMACSCETNEIKIWNTETGKLLKTLNKPGDTSYFTSFDFNPVDKQKIIAGTSDSKIKILSTENYEVINSIDAPIAGYLPKIDFSPDGKKIVAGCMDGTVKLWDAATYELLKTIPVLNNTEPGVFYSRDSKKIMTDSDGNKIMIWDAETGDLLADLSNIDQPIVEKYFNNDSKKCIAVLQDNTIKIWDANSGELMYDISGHVKETREAEFGLDGNKLAAPYTVYLFDTNDSLIRLPSGYYECSPDAAKLLHYVTPDLKVISFEQLDVKYNRPDKVLEAIGSTDTALINSYRNAYVKRIKKLGITGEAFNDDSDVPEADFANRDNIKLEQTNENLELKIKANDNTYQLDRYNIWINEVPLFGQRGFSIRNQNYNGFNKTISIQLSPGENKIETSVTNSNGIESYRMPLFVKYIPQTTIDSKVYFIGIGINEFADNSHNLTWCVQDIKDLTTSMQSKYKEQFVVLDTFYNQNVTIRNIQSLKEKLLHTNINDKVIIAYSGHGLLSKDYDYYLSSYNVNFNKPEEEGIPYDAIENLLDSIPAREKVLLLDACHSGELDKEELQKINISTADLVKNNIKANPGSKGVFIEDNDTGKLGLQNSFELMQNVFVNVGKGTGAIIISASGGVQFAQERSELGHGVFTYSVIEAMNKYPSMKVSDFKKYVGNRVLELTNGLQKPTTRNETIAVDWNVW